MRRGVTKWSPVATAEKPSSSAARATSRICSGSVCEIACQNSIAAGLGELQHAARVLAQELRPDLVLQRDLLHLGHDALEGEPHREVARVEDLVGAARVRVVEDRLRVVLGGERAGAV